MQTSCPCELDEITAGKYLAQCLAQTRGSSPAPLLHLPCLPHTPRSSSTIVRPYILLQGVSLCLSLLVTEERISVPVLRATCRRPLHVCFHCWPSTTAKGTPIHRKPPHCLVGLPSALSGAALLTGLRNLDFLYHLRSHLFSPHILLLHPMLSPQNHEVSADVSLGFGFEHLFLNGLVVLTLVRQVFTQLPPRSLTEVTCLLVVFA